MTIKLPYKQINHNKPYKQIQKFFNIAILTSYNIIIQVISECVSQILKFTNKLYTLTMINCGKEVETIFFFSIGLIIIHLDY